MISRHIMRGWFFKRAVLQVWYRGRWRDATANDLTVIDRDKRYQVSQLHADRIIPVGDRVRINKQAGFARGAEGIIVFQEPRGGRVWVLRDDADGPCYFWNHELDIIR